jgi:hypothetical protein
MPQRRPRFELLLPILLTVALASGCSGPVTIPSQSATEAPSVDGALGDWGGNLTYVEDRPVSMSALPTDSLLYVALNIQDRGLIRSIAANGLVVWIDPAGGQQRTYGIQYPLGLRAQRVGTGASGSESSGEAGSAIQKVNLSELVVMWGDSTRRRIPADFSSGLRARATLNPGSLIYELAIPVGGAPSGTAGREHGLDVPLGRTVGIGLKTPDPEDEDTDIAAPNTGVPSVTGRPGRGRTRRGRRGRQQRQRQPQRAEIPRLDLWTKVVTKEK